MTTMDFLGWVTLLAFGIGVYSGFANRLFGSVMVLLNLVFSSIVAAGFYLVLGNLGAQHLWFGEVSYGASYLFLFVLSIVGVTMVTDLYFKVPPKLDRNLDRIGGLVVGIPIGLVLAGTLGVGWMLLPFRNGVASGRTVFRADKLVVKIYTNLGVAAPGMLPFDKQRHYEMYVEAYPDYHPLHDPSMTMKHLCDGMMNDPEANSKEFQNLDVLNDKHALYAALEGARNRKGAQVFISITADEPVEPKLDALMAAPDGQRLYYLCDFTFRVRTKGESEQFKKIVAWERNWENRKSVYVVYADGSVRRMKSEGIAKLLDAGMGYWNIALAEDPQETPKDEPKDDPE